MHEFCMGHQVFKVLSGQQTHVLKKSIYQHWETGTVTWLSTQLTKIKKAILNIWLMKRTLNGSKETISYLAIISYNVIAMPNISEISIEMKTHLYQNITKVQKQKQNMKPKPTWHVHIHTHTPYTKPTQNHKRNARKENRRESLLQNWRYRPDLHYKPHDRSKHVVEVSQTKPYPSCGLYAREQSSKRIWYPRTD